MQNKLAITHVLAILTAVGVDVYAQNNELSYVAYGVIGALTIVCTYWHYVSANPKFNTNQDENFEKTLFVFSLNLLAMLAVFKMIRPEFDAWYQSSMDLGVAARALASFGVVALTGLAAYVAWQAMKATAFSADVTKDERRLQVDVCGYSAGMGAFVFMAPAIANPYGEALQPVLALVWIVLCIWVAVDAENKLQHSFAAYTPAVLAFGIVLLLGFPARSHLLEHGESLKTMSLMEALDFFFAVIFWVVATVKVTGDYLIKSLYKHLGHPA